MEEKEKKDYPDERYPVWGPAEPAPAEPLTWAISYDGKTPYALWDDGDGALLDLEIKRLGGTWSKMALYAAPEARKPYPSYAAEEATRSKQVAHAAPAELACDIQPRPLAYSLADYALAMIKGPLHYTWQDKPHRLVYDLIAAVRYYAAPVAPAPQLPPMPEPHWPRYYQGSVPPGAYTADQMKAYARAAIEAASKGEQG